MSFLRAMTRRIVRGAKHESAKGIHPLSSVTTIQKMSEPVSENAEGAPLSREPVHATWTSPWTTWLAKTETVLVTDLITWNQVLETAAAARRCAIDTETVPDEEALVKGDDRAALDPHQANIRLVQLAVPVFPKGSRSLVSEAGHGPNKDTSIRTFVLDILALTTEDRSAAFNGLAKVLEDPNVTVIGHNMVFELKMLEVALGHRVATERLFDTMIASQLVNAGYFVPHHCFDAWIVNEGLQKRVLGDKKEHFYDKHNHEISLEKDWAKALKPHYLRHDLYNVAHRHLEVVLDKSHQKKPWSGTITKEMLAYASTDATILLPLYEILRQLLKKNALIDVARIEFDCLPATAEIEVTGMPFEAAQATVMLKQAELELSTCRITIKKVVQTTGFQPQTKKSAPAKGTIAFNPQSSKEVLDCLRHLAQTEGLLSSDGQSFIVGNITKKLSSLDDVLTQVSARLQEGSKLNPTFV